MKKITIKKNSWHYRLQAFCHGYNIVQKGTPLNTPPENLPGYIFATLLCFIVLPERILAFSIVNLSDRFEAWGEKLENSRQIQYR